MWETATKSKHTEVHQLDFEHCKLTSLNDKAIRIGRDFFGFM